MASQNLLMRRLLATRPFTLSAISLVSLSILLAAFCQAITSPSIPAVFALLLYTIVLPLSSQLYLSIEYLLGPSQTDTHGNLTNNIVLALSFLMTQGWIVNTAFWTDCEIYEKNRKWCPFKTRRESVSTAKVVLSYMITVVFIARTATAALEVLNNSKAQLADKAGLLTHGDMHGDEVKEMAEDDGISDDAMFDQDLVIAGKGCI
jgi:hypothetical protein